MAFSKDKKTISLILILILGTLILGLWWLKTTSVVESFDIDESDSYIDGLDRFGNQALNLGGAAQDYATGQTNYVGVSNGVGGGTGNEVASYYAYNNLGDTANMRAQTPDVDYIKTIANPTALEKVKMAAYDPSVYKDDKTIYVGTEKDGRPPTNFNINDLAVDIINQNPQQSIQWSNVFIDDTKNNKNTITVIKTPDNNTPLFMDDACSKKGILNSNFKEDICTLHAGDNMAIDKKCRELSSKNCSIPSCCVLLNNTTCVGGNASGPTFNSKNGVEIDYSYYYYKNKCYGEGCLQSQKSIVMGCDEYTPNSTGVTKACMIYMLSEAGCHNPNPDWIITDEFVKANSQSTHRYIDNYLRAAVRELNDNLTVENLRLCHGGGKNRNIDNRRPNPVAAARRAIAKAKIAGWTRDESCDFSTSVNVNGKCHACPTVSGQLFKASPVRMSCVLDEMTPVNGTCSDGYVLVGGPTCLKLFNRNEFPAPSGWRLTVNGGASGISDPSELRPG